jgi:hypothetical protein
LTNSMTKFILEVDKNLYSSSFKMKLKKLEEKHD